MARGVAAWIEESYRRAHNTLECPTNADSSAVGKLIILLVSGHDGFQWPCWQHGRRRSYRCTNEKLKCPQPMPIQVPVSISLLINIEVKNQLFSTFFKIHI